MTKPIVLCVDIELWAEANSVTKRTKEVTTIQLSPATRDRLYRLKFRATYDEFLNELCDLYERTAGGEQK